MTKGENFYPQAGKYFDDPNYPNPSFGVLPAGLRTSTVKFNSKVTLVRTGGLSGDFYTPLKAIKNCVKIYKRHYPTASTREAFEQILSLSDSSHSRKIFSIKLNYNTEMIIGATDSWVKNGIVTRIGYGPQIKFSDKIPTGKDRLRWMMGVSEDKKITKFNHPETRVHFDHPKFPGVSATEEKRRDFLEDVLFKEENSHGWTDIEELFELD